MARIIKQSAALLLLVAAIATTISSINALAANKLQEAYLHYQSHRFKEAIVAFDEHIRANPRDANAIYYDALCNQQVGNIPRAKSLYRQVVQINPGSQIATYAESILIKVDPSYRSSSSSSDPSYRPQSSSSSSSSSSASRSNHSASSVSDVDSSAPGQSAIKGPDQANVYYRPNGRQIMVTVEINGRPVEMMLDTGAPGICIGKEQLQSIGVSPPDGPPTGETGGAANASRVATWNMNVSLKVGPFTDPNCKLKVMASEGGNALLGQSFIKNFEYSVDQSAHCIRFIRKGGASSQAQGYSLPFTFRKSGNRIIVEGEINGRKNNFMMDTGNSGSGIAFHSPEQAAKYGAPVPEGARIGTFHGVSGSGQAYIYDISHLRIGPIDRNDVKIAAHMGGGFGGEEPLLGHEIFEGWQYTIDYDKKVIHLLRR